MPSGLLNTNARRVPAADAEAVDDPKDRPGPVPAQQGLDPGTDGEETQRMKEQSIEFRLVLT